jgi:hypothetical protein
MTLSNTKRNRVRDNVQPWLTPVVTYTTMQTNFHNLKIQCLGSLGTLSLCEILTNQRCIMQCGRELIKKKTGGYLLVIPWVINAQFHLSVNIKYSIFK